MLPFSGMMLNYVEFILLSDIVNFLLSLVRLVSTLSLQLYKAEYQAEE